MNTMFSATVMICEVAETIQ